MDHERGRLVLYTVYLDGHPPEYTDVVFEGVAAHHFERQVCGVGPLLNVLFDAAEADPSHVLGEYGDVPGRNKNHGWPSPGYDTVDDLTAQLTAGGAKCYQVAGSRGLGGFAFAAAVRFRARESRAEPIT